MGSGSEQYAKTYLRMTREEAYDTVRNIVESRNKSKFSVKSEDRPNKLLAYGGRGASKFVKATFGAATFGLGAAALHYTMPKRSAMISFKDYKDLTIMDIKSEGWTDGDSRISTFVNEILDGVSEYVVDEMEIRDMQSVNSQPTQSQDDDPLKILKGRFVKGEITKEEFEDMKAALE